MTPSRKPPLSSRLHAAVAGEQSAAPLEALRVAGKAAYDELLQADRLREELAVAEIPAWTAPPGVGSQLLAAWMAYVLQTLGEALLDADYAADGRTVGFVPAATYEHALECLSEVADWIDRARRARLDPGYDLAAELRLPVPLPGWVATADHATADHATDGHAAALVLAVSSLRGQVELALHGLERTGVPAEHRPGVTWLKQQASRAATAAEYASSLHSSGNDPALAGVIRRNLTQALELWLQVGQLAAMPRLLAARGGDGPAPTAADAGIETDMLPAAARLRLAADLVDAVVRAGADERIDAIVSAKFGGITVQVPSSGAGAAVQDRLTLVNLYARVLGIRPVREPMADGGGYWYKAVGQFAGCPVEAWASIEGV